MMFSAPEQTWQNGKAFAASFMDKISLIPSLPSQQSDRRSVGVSPLAFGFSQIMTIAPSMGHVNMIAR
jgi:hypothetical protein